VVSDAETDTPDFESAFRQLEETVQALEKGGLTLAEATSLYEQGMGLVKACSERLDTAELRIKDLQTAFVAKTDPGETSEEAPDALDESSMKGRM